MSATKTYAWSGKNPPWTSWTTTQKTQTFDAVKAAGVDGITREKICTVTNLPKQRVWFYLSELRRAGLIKRLGDTVDPTTMSPLEAKVHALSSLENAFSINAGTHAKTCTTCRSAKDDESRKCDEWKLMSKAFIRYNKIKALAMGAKTDGEMTSALRAAIIDLVKMVF